MKGKKYIKPETEIVKVFTRQEMALTIESGTTDMNLSREDNLFDDGAAWSSDDADSGSFWED